MNWAAFFLIVACVVGLMFFGADQMEKKQLCRDNGGEVVRTYNSWTCIQVDKEK